MSNSGMSASLKARMQHSPRNKNKDKISIVCFAGDTNATSIREIREGHSCLYPSTGAQALLMLSSPGTGQKPHKAKLLSDCDTANSKKETLIIKQHCPQSQTSNLGLILERLPGNLPVLLKSKEYVLNYKRLQGHFCGKFGLSFHAKKTPQCYRDPFGNNIFLSLLSTFQQSLTATVPRRCLYPALKESGGSSVPGSTRKSRMVSSWQAEKQTREDFLCRMQG